MLGVEKRVQSPLLESSSVEKIMEIDAHIGAAMSGLTADARTMIDHARVTAQVRALRGCACSQQNHNFVYDEDIQVETLTQSVCDLALRFGESTEDDEAMMSRPFGVALLIVGIDENGPQLFHADPSGTFVRYEAKAIGSGSEGAQGELQDKYNKDLSLHDASLLTLRVLKQVMEEKLDENNVQLATVTPRTAKDGRTSGQFTILDTPRLKELVDAM